MILSVSSTRLSLVAKNQPAIPRDSAVLVAAMAMVPLDLSSLGTYPKPFFSPLLNCCTHRSIFIRMDLHEDAEKNTVTATFEFPGLSKDDVQVDVNNGRLTVSAESKKDVEKEEHGYAVRERQYGKFLRTLQLPQGVKVCL
jgi:HSP20 family molecular chaperone IbpA